MNNNKVSITPEEKRELDQLFARNGDRLQEEQLVEAARPKDSILHDLFPWDDHRAAEDFRKQIAARILRSYYVVRFRLEQPDGNSVRKSLSVPLAVKVRPEADADKIWVKTPAALQDDFTRTQLIADRIAWIKRAIRQISFIPELKGLYDQLLQTIEKYPIPKEVQKTAP